MQPNMFTFRYTNQVLQFIVILVLIFVMNVIPFWNASMEESPYITMQTLPFIQVCLFG